MNNAAAALRQSTIPMIPGVDFWRKVVKKLAHIPESFGKTVGCLKSKVESNIDHPEIKS